MKKAIEVRIKVEVVGASFGHRGVICSARTGRELTTTRVHPYGFESAAIESARELAAERGYVVADDEAEYR